jgi:hypothetical protein
VKLAYSDLGDFLQLIVTEALWPVIEEHGHCARFAVVDFLRVVGLEDRDDVFGLHSIKVILRPQ